ncbi:uncharacterized protein LOC120012081 isoform X2 [Tripterygium wilfordii]|uniref:uncharacterized protein LOC120012081 isoform X2 n=1 Tax=Tripterygium wilfordii TaxID=458696 RepID=UPI0018F84077|nr:uncharacterized protein LOC120012081 isoform X2 [Tripterygium wilfordii]
MDYSLAALKVVCAQLKDAHDVPSQNALTLGGILFQRAWLQGILVSNSGDGRFLLDDGTGVIELHLSGDFRSREWDVGCTCFFLLSSTFLVRLLVRLLGLYVMVVGGYFLRKGDTPMVKDEIQFLTPTSTCHRILRMGSTRRRSIFPKCQDYETQI